MKKQLTTVWILCITVLIGCAAGQTFEDFFHGQMEENEEEWGNEIDYSYSLVHKEKNVVHEDDAIAVFTEHNQNGYQIFIAYFEREKNKWYWRQTRGAEWNTPVQWSSMNEVPYIYSGATTDDSIAEVYVGDTLAKVIKVENDKRFWYAVSDVKNVEVTVVKKDGSKEILDESNEELLKDWDR